MGPSSGESLLDTAMPLVGCQDIGLESMCGYAASQLTLLINQHMVSYTGVTHSVHQQAQCLIAQACRTWKAAQASSEAFAMALEC